MTLPIILLAITSIISGGEFYNYFKNKNKWALILAITATIATILNIQHNFL